MAEPVLTTTNTSDVAKGTAETDWGKVAPAASGATTTERIWNDLAAAGTDDFTDGLGVAMAKIDGTSVWQGGGIDLLDRRGVQFRFTKINSVAVSNAWTNVGNGVGVTAPTITAGTYHEYEFRATPPVGAAEVVTDLKISWGSAAYQAVANPWAAEPGIHRGIGTGKTTAVLARSIEIAVSSTDTFEWPDFSWINLGVPYVSLDHDETISEVDGSAASLAAGEGYIFLAVLDAGGTTIVKGDATATPLTYPDDAPAQPADTELLGWGERFDDGDAISMTWTKLGGNPAFFALSDDGALTGTVARSGGPAVVDGNLPDSQTATTYTLTDASTNTVQLLQDGSIGVTTDGSLSQNGAQKLGDQVTAGGVVTSTVDRRRWSRGVPIRFEFTGSPTGTTTAVWINPFRRAVYIRSDSLRLMLDLVPVGAGKTVTAELFTTADNAARVTCFTSFASDDRRLIVQHGDTSAISDFTDSTPKLPEVVKVDIDEALECDLIVAGGATPAWAVVSLITDKE